MVAQATSHLLRPSLRRVGQGLSHTNVKMENVVG
jgi:hypothetical protein